MAVSIKGPIVFANDMAKMTAFYRDVVGLTYVKNTLRDDEFVTFIDGGNTFALHAALPHQRARVSNPPAVRWNAATKVVFRVDDLKNHHDKLVERGLTSTWGSVEDRLVDFVDPEGNVFQLTDL